jgi:hypothetical protein
MRCASEKERRYSEKRSLGGPYNLSGGSGEAKNPSFSYNSELGLSILNSYCMYAETHRFSKYLDTTQKFWAPEKVI